MSTAGQRGSRRRSAQGSWSWAERRRAAWSLARRPWVVLLVAAGVATSDVATAQCTGEPEIESIRFRLGGYTWDHTHALDEARFEGSYDEIGKDMVGFIDYDIPQYFWFHTDRTWAPGDDWMTIHIYSTEVVKYGLSGWVTGTCFRRIVHVGGPDLGFGTTGPCHQRCTYALRHAYWSASPHYVWEGLSEYHIIGLDDRVLAKFAIDIDIIDARIRVQYGPARSPDGRLHGRLHTPYAEYLPHAAIPSDLDTIRSPIESSDPIVSRCVAGPWTYEELWTEWNYTPRRGAPERPPPLERWPYVCRSFAQCVPNEAQMTVHGEIPPSLLDTAEINRFPWIASGSYGYLEFTPTVDEIGTWNMEIQCADNEGNIHRRPWTVIVEPDPNERMWARTLCGCSSSADRGSQVHLAVMLLPLLLLRRRP